MLVVGVLLARAIVRHRTRARPLTSEEHEQARRLLEGDDGDADDANRESQ